jgi:uncharacterized membrane protein YkvI
MLPRSLLHLVTCVTQYTVPSAAVSRPNAPCIHYCIRVVIIHKIFLYELRCVLRKKKEKEQKLSVISGFRRDVDEICALLGYYAASSGNTLTPVRVNRSVSS